ncbi:MAG: hypothetical protein K2L56_07460 [Prevotella sp.]|nr:hypothetical protein [Prevotella sp.]
MKICVGIYYGFQLTLHFFKPHKTFKYGIQCQWLSTPSAILGYDTIIPLAMFTLHI